MSQLVSPVASRVSTTINNTIPVLSSGAPVQYQSSLPLATNASAMNPNLFLNNGVPLERTSLAPLSVTGLVAPNTLVTPVSLPGLQMQPQTVNAYSGQLGSVPIRSGLVPMPQMSPVITMRPPSPTISIRPPSPSIRMPTNVGTQTSDFVSTSPMISVRPPSPTISARPSSIRMPTTGTVSVSPLFNSFSSVKMPSNQGVEVENYQGVVANASIENELLNSGYTPINKITIREDNGSKKIHYIESLNKKGQHVFVAIDTPGYATVRTSDLTLIKATNASIVPYSIKMGAYNCAGSDVCGVAFKCGSDSICVLSRGNDDLSPQEANFVFVEPHLPSAGMIQTADSIIPYPVVKLSEIRANPELVLMNTDIVTSRLRNSSYKAEVEQLGNAKSSVSKLVQALERFDRLREVTVLKLTTTLNQLNEWNDIYMKNPPMSDIGREKYRQLQFNMANRNQGISDMLTTIQKVAAKHREVDRITNEINELSDMTEKAFENVEYAVNE